MTRDETDELTGVLITELLEKEFVGDWEHTPRGRELDDLIGVCFQYYEGFFDPD